MLARLQRPRRASRGAATSISAMQPLDLAQARPARRRGAASTRRRRRRRSAGTPRTTDRCSARPRSRPGRRRPRRPRRPPRAARRSTRCSVGRPSTSTDATQPSGSVMIASRAPRLDHLAHGDQAVLVVVELVADELLGLEHVGRDDVGLGAHRVAHRVAVGVDDGLHAELAQLADRARRRRRARRRAAASRRTPRPRRPARGRAACRGRARPPWRSPPARAR